MQFADFATLSATEVSHLVAERKTTLGVAMPFNGTRRWYLAVTGNKPDSLYSDDYSRRVRQRMWEIEQMLFADGVTAIYSPTMGRALAARGPEYMAYAAAAIAWLADEDAVRWSRDGRIATSFYGEIELLPEAVQKTLRRAEEQTLPDARHYLRYGVFADRAVSHIIRLTLELRKSLERAPTDMELLEHYYGAPVVPVDIWLGTDQPTVYDVPLALHESTALYFLQFPTPFLDQPTWRRILYDYLFVRGDEETLYPENLGSGQYSILGLGMRREGGWQAILG